LLAEQGLRLAPKPHFVASRRASTHLFALDPHAVAQVIAGQSGYGDIVCRCEMISAQEIREAIARGARTLDGIKFRTRAQAGRCHGGFCTTRLMKILHEETGLPLASITKRGPGSELLAGIKRPLAQTGAARPQPSPAQQPLQNAYDLVVVGAGPAGMAAALAARAEGIESVLLLERDTCLGGILNQCIHHGFGLHHFKEELTGPEYAERFAAKVAADPKLMVSYQSLVVNLTAEKKITLLRPGGLHNLQAKAVILATGCRERTREMIHIPGTRPSGIYPAGLAQKMVNLEGWLPGRKVVVIGSGDIGLIMARRLTWEGLSVSAVVEIEPVSHGLVRNVVQCLEDYAIPLYLQHTVVEIQGASRVTAVRIAPVDADKRPDLGRAFEVECDTVLISAGLIPENELLEKAGVPLDPVSNTPAGTSLHTTTILGIFACGNSYKIYDLVDWVTRDSAQAGKQAAAYIQSLQS
jgi:thioredoxin reductase/bacterioferritin-associated ferredoxin